MEEKLAQEEPEERISNELFHHILQTTTDGFFLVSTEGKFALSGSSCDYEILPQSDLWQIDGDSGQIIQNIVLNAEQSMPQGGKIEIAVQIVCNSGVILHRK